VCARTRLRVHCSTRRHLKPCSPRLNVALLQSSAKQQELSSTPSEALPKNLTGHYAEQWESLKTIVYSTAKSVLGTQTCQHKDWFDSNDEANMSLLDKKREAFAVVLALETPKNRVHHQQIKSLCRRERRRMQNQWWINKTK